MKQSILDASAKAAPPVAVVGWDTLLNVPLDQWVKVATLVYIVLQAFFLVADRVRRRTIANDIAAGK